MYKLTSLRGLAEPKEFSLKEGKNTIGRGEECDVRLDSEFVSKQHAVITVKGSEMTLEDLKSRNGTFLNGVMIQTAKLKPGDRISFQEIVLELRPMIPKKISPPPQSLSKWDQFRQQVISPYLEKLTERIEWKYLMLALFLLFIGISFLVTVPPIVTEMQTKIQTETIKRAELIVRRIARENQKHLTIQNNALVPDLLNLSTALAREEERILSAHIVDSLTKKIIAPAEKLNQTLDEAGPVLRGAEAQKMSIEKLNSNRIVVSYPIFVYSPQENQEVPAAVVQAIFNTEGLGLSPSEHSTLLLKSLLFLLLTGALFYFSFMQLTSLGLKKIYNEIESASDKGYRHLELRTKFEEVKSIVHSVNKVFKRTRELISNLPESLRQKEVKSENTDEILKQLLQLLPDGIAVLNDSYQTLLYNPAFQKMTASTGTDLHERNILDIIQNQGLLQSISLSLGQAAQGKAVIEDLQISEKHYQLSVSAIRAPNNEIDFYILKIREPAS